MRKLILAWNYWWLNYHLIHLKKHDVRIEDMIPDWKIRFVIDEIEED